MKHTTIIIIVCIVAALLLLNLILTLNAKGRVIPFLNTMSGFKFFKGVGKAIENEAAKIDQWLHSHVMTGISIAEGFKKAFDAIQSNAITVGIIDLVVPASLEASIAAKIDGILSDVIQCLVKFESAEEQAAFAAQSIDEQAKDFISSLSNLSDDVKNAIYSKVASLTTAKLNGNALPGAQYDSIVQAAYAPVAGLVHAPTIADAPSVILPAQSQDVPAPANQSYTIEPAQKR